MKSEDMKAMIDTLVKWRTDLHEPKRRGARAELRRAKNITDVIMTPTYQRLCTHLSEKLESFNDKDKESLAFIAGLLSHVREVSKSKNAKSMSMGSPACVSELRFRRLLQHEKDDRFYAAMIRIIRMLKYTVNVDDLIESMYYWDDSKKKNWAYAYFS
jgi:CRISPR type I-E-associated protein CasB/Cse2